MRIVSFWARGFRSLRDVRVDGLGAFNVLYGPNGSGKSNFLAAIRILLALAAATARDERFPLGAPNIERARAARAARLVSREDLCARDPSRVIVLGAHLSSNGSPSPVLVPGYLELPDLELEVTFDWLIDQEPRLSISKLRSEGHDLHAPWADPRDHERLRALLLEGLVCNYALVSADRAPRTETTAKPPDDEDVVLWHLRQGRLKSALLAAQIGPSHETRRRLTALRALLAGPPLNRPPFDPVQDPRTGIVDIREVLPEPNPDGRDVSLDLAGLGIAQIYWILGQTMLSGARAVGIEEPEAHLHAPTTGRDLRLLLARLVHEGHIDQLFIATHSNLFDLDDTGFFDVQLDNGETKVTRKTLAEIDQHLYEPGPTLHALEELLSIAPADKVMFRRPDGSPVTAIEMVKLLRESNPIALDYLRTLHAAAVDVVGLRNRRGRSS
ncbi:MAG: AAA family ATPase [Byssovorax sp.]